MVPLSVLRSLRMQHWSGKYPAIFAPRHWVIIKHDHVLSRSITFLHSQHQHLTLICRPPSSLFQDFQAHSEVLDTKAHCFARQLLNNLNTIETMISTYQDWLDWPKESSMRMSHMSHCKLESQHFHLHILAFDALLLLEYVKMWKVAPEISIISSPRFLEKVLGHQLKRWNRETVKPIHMQPRWKSDSSSLAIEVTLLAFMTWQSNVMYIGVLWWFVNICDVYASAAVLLFEELPPQGTPGSSGRWMEMRWNDIKHGFRLKPTATPFGALQRKKGSFKVCSRAASIWGFLATKMPGRSDGSSMAVKTFRLQLHATVSYDLSSHAKSWTLEWNVQIISPKNLSKHVKTALKVALVGFWKTERTWINRLPPQVWNCISGQEQICWSNGKAPLLPHGWSHSLPWGTRNDMTKRSETSCPHGLDITLYIIAL